MFGRIILARLTLATSGSRMHRRLRLRSLVRNPLRVSHCAAKKRSRSTMMDHARSIIVVVQIWELAQHVKLIKVQLKRRGHVMVSSIIGSWSYRVVQIISHPMILYWCTLQCRINVSVHLLLVGTVLISHSDEETDYLILLEHSQCTTILVFMKYHYY